MPVKSELGLTALAPTMGSQANAALVLMRAASTDANLVRKPSTREKPIATARVATARVVNL